MPGLALHFIFNEVLVDFVFSLTWNADVAHAFMIMLCSIIFRDYYKLVD